MFNFKQVIKHLKPFDMFYSLYYFFPFRRWNIYGIFPDLFKPRKVDTPSTYIICQNIHIDPDGGSEESHFDTYRKQNPWTSMFQTFAFKAKGDEKWTLLPWCTPWKLSDSGIQTYGLNGACAKTIGSRKVEIILIL